MRLSFDAIASQFDNQRGLPREALQAWIRLIDQIAGGSTVHVIEPGIGTGRISLPVAAMGHHVTGTDISVQMLDQCSASARQLGVTSLISLTEADATDLPYADAQFDLGIIAQLLYLVPDWPTVLDELARVVKPGGSVIHLTEPTTEGHSLSLWSTTWRELIEATGYRHTPLAPTDADVHAEFLRRWPDVQVRQLASWSFGQTVAEAIGNYAERVRPLYGEIETADFDRVVAQFLTWAKSAYPNDQVRLEGTVTLTVMIASA